MKTSALTPRLAAAAAFARQGAIAADVGTDHAALPVFLVSGGITPRAVASDINRGPLERAERNIGLAGLSGSIKTVLTDGLDGIDEYNPDDIYILGMGGELIARIVLGSQLARRAGVRLILQPMTRAAELRSALYSGGFDITDEALAAEGGRIYQIICAEYDGIIRSYGKTELLLGRHNIARGGALLAALARKSAAAIRKRADGLENGGTDGSAERALAAELDAVVGKAGANP